ncbi:MAG: DUF4388 domain-containing protein [Actinobacteria bacterium]|nr:DUF4388 domain-containing protein [Actinomycetota bacterium]
MSIEGSLTDFSISEVIQLFSIGKKTGLVKFKAGDFSGLIAFESGLVYYSESSNEKGSISERLVKERKISSRSLRQAQGLLKITKGEKSLLDILVENHFIEKSELEISIKNIIIDAIFDIGLNDNAQFVFSQEEKKQDEFAVVRISQEEIENELIRRQKTWEAIQKKITDTNSVFVLSPEAADRASEIRLKPLEWKILCLLNGENTLKDIYRILEISPYKAGKTAYGLLAAGLIQPLRVSDYVAEEYFSEIKEGR